MGRVFLLVPLRSTSSILYSMALKISQVSSKWRDDYGLFSGTIVLTVHQFIYPIKDRNFSMDATLVVYANGDNKSIHGRGRSWSAERGRCKRSSMIHYGARPEWTEWNIYIYMKFEDLQVCWQRRADMLNQLHMLSVLGTIVLQILLTWPEFWLVVC